MGRLERLEREREERERERREPQAKMVQSKNLPLGGSPASLRL
jgi:hypothetical protein